MARIAESRKKRSFKKFTFRGIDLDKLLDLKPEELMPLVSLAACWQCGFWYRPSFLHGSTARLADRVGCGQLGR